MDYRSSASIALSILYCISTAMTNPFTSTSEARVVWSDGWCDVSVNTGAVKSPHATPIEFCIGPGYHTTTTSGPVSTGDYHHKFVNSFDTYLGTYVI